MLNGIHFLLTYQCTYKCDHCFLFCTPDTYGTFTIDQIDAVLSDAQKIKTMEWIFFEGGEPLMFYPLLLEAIKRTKKMGFKTGLVTNCYPVQSEADAEIWLNPLKEAGIDNLSISNDKFHSDNPERSPASIVCDVGRRIGLPVFEIAIKQPQSNFKDDSSQAKGKPIIEGGPKFKGRAAINLVEGLPLRKPAELTECPYEELTSPERVHIDAFGNTFVCQGISIGNLWKTPLSSLIRQYRMEDHPICAPIHQGGPLELAKTLDFPIGEGYVDECHLCFLTRRSCIDRFPEYLTPRQVYGIE